MKKNLTEKDIIHFLAGYPDSTASQQEKNRTIRRVNQEIKKTWLAQSFWQWRKSGCVKRYQPKSTSNLDYLFTVFFVPLLLLALGSSLLPAASELEILAPFPGSEALKHIPIYIGLAGIIGSPMLLTILPLSGGGDNQ